MANRYRFTIVEPDGNREEVLVDADSQAQARNQARNLYPAGTIGNAEIVATNIGAAPLTSIPIYNPDLQQGASVDPATIGVSGIRNPNINVRVDVAEFIQNAISNVDNWNSRVKGSAGNRDPRLRSKDINTPEGIIDVINRGIRSESVFNQDRLNTVISIFEDELRDKGVSDSEIQTQIGVINDYFRTLESLRGFPDGVASLINATPRAATRISGGRGGNPYANVQFTPDVGFAADIFEQPGAFGQTAGNMGVFGGAESGAESEGIGGMGGGGIAEAIAAGLIDPADLDPGSIYYRPPSKDDNKDNVFGADPDPYDPNAGRTNGGGALAPGETLPIDTDFVDDPFTSFVQQVAPLYGDAFRRGPFRGQIQGLFNPLQTTFNTLAQLNQLGLPGGLQESAQLGGGAESFGEYLSRLGGLAAGQNTGIGNIGRQQFADAFSALRGFTPSNEAFGATANIYDPLGTRSGEGALFATQLIDQALQNRFRSPVYRSLRRPSAEELFADFQLGRAGQGAFAPTFSGTDSPTFLEFAAQRAGL